MGFFIGLDSNHSADKASYRYKDKYFDPNCIRILEHNYTLLLLRILIVTNKLATTIIIANVTGSAQTTDDAEIILKKQ